MKSKRIYLDYATTTLLDPEVEKVMRPYQARLFGNPDSIHSEGVVAARALSAFRARVARVLQAREHEIIFTSGGTESNNLAIQGVIQEIKNQKSKIKDFKPHVVTSVIEHASVLEPIRVLEEAGDITATYVSVDGDGILDLVAFKKALRPETVLVSVMHANNEIGTIQPVRKIARLILDSRSSIPYTLYPNPFLHTDACQSALYLLLDQNRLGADLISFDAHKMYGPKGVGALYVRKGVALSPIMYGGGQERGCRPGTVPLPLIAGFSEALSLAAKRREKSAMRVETLRNYFFEKIKISFPSAVINGSITERLPNNVHISIPGLNAEFAVLQLDALGVSCSAKSACLENERESYVVKALGRRDNSEHSSLRFTLGSDTTKRDIDETVRLLTEVLRRQKITVKT